MDQFVQDTFKTAPAQSIVAEEDQEDELMPDVSAGDADVLADEQPPHAPTQEPPTEREEKQPGDPEPDQVDSIEIEQETVKVDISETLPQELDELVEAGATEAVPQISVQEDQPDAMEMDDAPEVTPQVPEGLIGDVPAESDASAEGDIPVEVEIPAEVATAVAEEAAQEIAQEVAAGVAEEVTEESIREREQELIDVVARFQVERGIVAPVESRETTPVAINFPTVETPGEGNSVPQSPLSVRLNDVLVDQIQTPPPPPRISDIVLQSYASAQVSLPLIPEPGSSDRPRPSVGVYEEM